MTARAALISAGLLSVLLSGCARKEPLKPLANDAYIWQRHWGNALSTALAESASSIRLWRVLAAEAEGGADLTKISVDRQTLRRTGKPVIAVIRIDGRRRGIALNDLLSMHSTALAADWKKDGVPVHGIEIDYDCATKQLALYRTFLRSLRQLMGRDMTLSITALPSWMGSSDLPGLLTEVDEVILQVHSVMSSKKGLFDQARAVDWAQAWSALCPVPFRVALPTYWSRVTWNGEGRVMAIESEVARYGTDPESRELIVEPAEVSSVVTELRRRRPHRLVGFAWFRLPTRDDQRSWTIRTWQAVMRGQPIEATTPVVRFQMDQTGARDVYLQNKSDVDRKLPPQVLIWAKGCESADALPLYSPERERDRIRFVLEGNDLLRSGEERLVGWIRCADGRWEGRASF